MGMSCVAVVVCGISDEWSVKIHSLCFREQVSAGVFIIPPHHSSLPNFNSAIPPANLPGHMDSCLSWDRQSQDQRQGGGTLPTVAGQSGGTSGHCLDEASEVAVRNRRESRTRETNSNCIIDNHPPAIRCMGEMITKYHFTKKKAQSTISIRQANSKKENKIKLWNIFIFSNWLSLMLF